jgi:hypothetical protein
MLLAYSSSQYIAFWSGVTGVTAATTGTIAIATFRSLRRDSRDRTRPVLSAELLPVVLARGTSELVVQNIGASVATNIRVAFDPPIPDTGTLSAYLVRRYAHPIPTMGPGRRLTNIYAQMVDGQPDEPVPEDFTVAFDYEDSRGDSYHDRYLLSLKTLLNQTTSQPSNTDEPGMRKRLLAALEAIARGVGH